MNTIYDTIGKDYIVGRKTDPDIAQQITVFLDSATSIVNIGAGTGSYEPADKPLVAIEPSIEMIQQRAADAHPVTQGVAESLPFKNASFSHSMTVLSMHHWRNRKKAFQEIRRVTQRRFVAVTYNPEAPTFWLNGDYFPEIYQLDRQIFPTQQELTNEFSGIKFYPLAIPAKCQDGFLAAYWARPEAYLDPIVRNNMSTFSMIDNQQEGLKKLKTDLESGVWDKRFGHLRSLDKLDVGYFIAVWDV